MSERTTSFGTSGWTEEELKKLQELQELMQTNRSNVLRMLVRETKVVQPALKLTKAGQELLKNQGKAGK